MLRFSETNKWTDPWFRKLKASEKIVFLYIVDNCNNAGFYELDIDMMSFQIGLDNERIEGAIKGLSRGLIGANNIVWAKNFLKHQKNWPINPDNNAHKQIINIFLENEKAFKGNKCFKEKLGAIKGLISPIGIGKGIGIGKVKVEDVKSYFKENGFNDELAIRFFNSYDSNHWKDSNGKPVKSWKMKAQSVWFKKENKTQTTDLNKLII